MTAMALKYHNTYRLKYNNTKLQRTEKRKRKTEGESHDVPVACKRSSRTENVAQEAYFFCGQPSGTDGLYNAATFQMDSQAQACAVLHEDT